MKIYTVIRVKTDGKVILVQKYKSRVLFLKTKLINRLLRTRDLQKLADT